MEPFFFHVNPPEQRGAKRDKKSRATFCGVITNNGNTLQVGVSYCHSVDQFCRRIGRIKAKGNALSQQHKNFDIGQIDEHNRNDYFVQICRGLCDTIGMNHQYQRRKKPIRISA